jgi:hypothetical protein
VRGQGRGRQTASNAAESAKSAFFLQPWQIATSMMKVTSPKLFQQASKAKTASE